ncbi:MAG: hypothetical protein F6K47_43015, partial [Symploca sp. SIO2E6]|nr:hypothetical protein [Symploca sp. SIO2E6]
HYIIVDKRDFKLFSQLQKPNTKIITKESILPWWIKRLPSWGSKNLWFSLKTIPIRGWLIQQFIKVAAAKYTSEDILVFVDSDVGFVRPFNLQDFIQGDQIRLFRVANRNNTQFSLKWNRSISRLLGLPPIDYPHVYVGQIVTWRRDNLLKLYQHLENISGKGWMETLCSSVDFSEYLIYGVFVDYVLKEQSGHYYDDQGICQGYWKNVAMSDQDLENFFVKVPDSCGAVMISAKSGISISLERYQRLLKMITNKH